MKLYALVWPGGSVVPWRLGGSLGFGVGTKGLEEAEKLKLSGCKGRGCRLWGRRCSGRMVGAVVWGGSVW